MSAAFRFKGDLETDPDLGLLWDVGCEALWQDGGEVVAYFPEKRDLPLEGNWESVATDDYLERYYTELEPVYLETLVVTPTHTEVSLRAGQKALWLDPGMAFGTGHHETTKLALEALEGLDLFGKEVLDVGAGSGILAIAADALGAARAHGVDNDPDTLIVAEENRRLNRSTATFSVGTVEDSAASSYDVIVANLFAELHVQLLSEYRRVLRPGGLLIVTGIMREKLAQVETALKTEFVVTKTKTDGEWSLVAAQLA